MWEEKRDDGFSLGCCRNGILPKDVTAGNWGKGDGVIGRMQDLCSPGGSCVLHNDNRQLCVCLCVCLSLWSFPTHT